MCRKTIQTNMPFSKSTQIDKVIIKSDLSVEDIRTISIGVFYENFPKLKEDVQKELADRIEEFSKNLVESIVDSKIEDLSEFSKIDMHYMLYEAQKAYVRTEEPELRKIIVDLLTKRADSKIESILKLNLNEVIMVIPRLTPKCRDILGLCFGIQRVRHVQLDNKKNDIELLKLYFNDKILPFYDLELPTQSEFKYLIYLGCASSGLGRQLGTSFVKSYPNFFNVVKQTGRITKIEGDDKDVNLIVDEGIEKNIKDYFIEIEPKLEKMFQIYNDLGTYSLNLTSVGELIGAYSYMIKTNSQLDIENWIY